MGAREFRYFRDLIHENAGIWLRDGKEIMLASRLSRRLRSLDLSTFAEYADYLRRAGTSSPEFVHFLNAVTTNKTSFFRERHHFDFLARTVVPHIQHEVLHGAPRHIRIWSAASSTGEEAYSIAITLYEALRASMHTLQAPPGSRLPAMRAPLPSLGGWKIEIVASDIDTMVLDAGRRGIYQQCDMGDVSQALMENYFLRGKDDMKGYVKVKQEIARLVTFQRINLMDARWPLEGLFDVIFFRNALIYFQQETQDVFLRRMARLLKPHGYLFLGNSEHIPWLQDVLEPLQKTMYRLRDG